MRGWEVAAGVIAALFVIGVGVGVLLVVAMPAFRRRRGAQDIGRENDHRRRYGLPPGYGDNDGGPGGQEPPVPDDHDLPPQWPGRRG